MIIQQPIEFEPYLKDTIWGGKAIAQLKQLGDIGRNIGESWEIGCVNECNSKVRGNENNLTLSNLIEIYGEKFLGEKSVEKFGMKFPILIKIIDANDNLSLQVHPDDKLASELYPGKMGKTEMWYILRAMKKAYIHAGLKRKITPDEYDSLVSSGSLMNVVRSTEAAPGQVYFIPAGQLHAIGAGNLLVEVQQSSDITFRVDDYGRLDSNGKPRDLHTELARKAIDFSSDIECLVGTVDSTVKRSKLVETDLFNVEMINVDGSTTLLGNEGSFTAITAVAGEADIKAGGACCRLLAGHSLLLPAAIGRYTVDGKISFLSTFIP